MAKEGWISLRIAGIKEIENADSGKKASLVREALLRYFNKVEVCPLCKGQGHIKKVQEEQP